ncbi:15453_t:CDS:2, partial [Funneliformis caledonium]
NLQDVKYSDSDLCKLSERIKPYISNVKPENAMKLTRWLFRVSFLIITRTTC